MDQCEVMRCYSKATAVVPTNRKSEEAEVCDEHSHAEHYRRWHCKYCHRKFPYRSAAMTVGPDHTRRCRRYANEGPSWLHEEEESGSEDQAD